MAQDQTGQGAAAPRWRAQWPLLAVALAVLALLAAGFHLGHQNALADLRMTQEVELRSRVQALESVLLRQRAVATVLADDAMMRQALLSADPGDRLAASQKLDHLRDETDSAVIYLLDRQGTAIAASNWDEPDSFVGQDYSFRDYFSEAVLQGEATQFALGTVSNRPGLYLSHDVRRAPDDGGEGLGVVVVKVEFDPLERNWADDAALTYVTDAAGQVILSGNPALRFGLAPPVADAVLARAAVPGTDWTMTIASSARPARHAALLTLGTVGFGLALLSVPALLLLRQRRRAAREAEAGRRYRADLERAVEERTRALSDEMRERQATEKRLSRLQDEMVQANKLAALGQITAGVAHEVNQPLATIRLLAENGAAMLPADQAPDVAANLSGIARMADRIGRITDQLRGFARKATGAVGPVSLREAVDVALLLTEAPRAAQGIRLEAPEIGPEIRVMAEAVRLEQILVNLLQNAQEALAGCPDPLIRIGIETGDVVRITVTDNGPGLSPEALAQLFIPFATSKPSGMGLGLVISQDIARDFGGSLFAAVPQPGQGASFVLELPGVAHDGK